MGECTRTGRQISATWVNQWAEGEVKAGDTIKDFGKQLLFQRTSRTRFHTHKKSKQKQTDNRSIVVPLTKRPHSVIRLRCEGDVRAAGTSVTSELKKKSWNVEVDMRTWWWTAGLSHTKFYLIA